jgi:hypothetical protein
MRIQRLMKLHRLMNQAGEGGSDTGGTGTGDGGDAAAAAKVIADATAAAAALAKAKEAEGKPTEAEAKLLKDMMKQKTRAGELEAQLNLVNEKLKAFEGIDAAKVKTLMVEQEEIERKRAIAEGDFDRLTKQMAERHTAEKSTMQEQIAAATSATSSLQKQIADLTVGGSFTSSKFVTEDLTLTPNKARVIYGPHFEYKDGKVVGFDKPAGASDRTMLVNSTGDALNFEDAMKKIVDADPDRDELIRSKMKPGAGSAPTKPAKGADSNQSNNLSGVEKIAAGLKALASKR